MRKQIAKGFVMLMLVVALAFVTAVVSASGQSPQARATVPFDFIVGDKTLPSGNYTVEAFNSAGQVLKIRNADAKGAAVRLTTPLNGESEHATLVFHRYGEQCFLAEVWSAGGYQGRELMKGRQERAMEKESAKIATLSGHAPRPTYETVAITVN